MRYDLAAIVKRAKKTRLREIVFREIVPPATLASNLYAEVYAPVVKAWTAAIPAIMAQYERTLMTADSAADIGDVLEETEDGLFRVALLVKLRLERWAAKVEGWQRSKWRGRVLSATGVDIGTMLGAGDMRKPLGTVIEANAELIRDVSSQARNRIGQAVFDGLTNRTTSREVAAKVREAVAMSRRRSLLIASDQLTKLTSALNEERALEAGIEGYSWVSSGKVNYRPKHKARNGKIFRWDSPPADGHPGYAIRCGCTSRARLSLDPADEF